MATNLSSQSEPAGLWTHVAHSVKAGQGAIQDLNLALNKNKQDDIKVVAGVTVAVWVSRDS
jgi:hypothetical protein